MAYLKINNKDFSRNVSSLKVKSKHQFNSQTNANGDSKVDYINVKKQVEFGIIPLSVTDLRAIMTEIQKFNVSLSFLDPDSGNLRTLQGIIPESDIDWYTIQVGKKLAKAFTVRFQQL